MSVLNLKYFDEGPGNWVFRRPQGVPQHSGRAFSLACVNFGLFATNGLKPTERFHALADLIDRQKQPLSFIAFLDITPPLMDALKEQPWVRKNFGVTDLHPMKGSVSLIGGDVVEKDTGCVFLVRHGIHVDFTESLSKQLGEFGQRPFTVLNMRQFCGLQCSFGVASFDPTIDIRKKADHMSAALSKLDNEFVVFASNFMQKGNGVVPSNERGELMLVKETLQFVEANELCTEPNSAVRECESGVMVKQANKMVPASVTPLASGKECDQLYRSATVVSFLSRGSASQGKESASAGGFAIPQPRSAAKPNARSDSPASPMPMFADPAVVSAAEAAREGFPSSPAAAAAQRNKKAESAAKWQNHNVIPLRGNNKNLNAEEAHYDLSSKFSSVREALDALKKGELHWSADYLVVGSVVLAAEGATSDLKGFRRYVQSNPAPKIIKEEVTQNVAQLVSNAARKATPVPPAEMGVDEPNVIQRPTRPVSRPRFWSEACATTVFQVSPLEMKFDITQHVGVTRNNLKAALQRLNTKRPDTFGSKPDPLQEYGFDYALLYAPEKQGYWLIAAADVPCDIMACRQAAGALV